jgi:hypothetical protein
MALRIVPNPSFRAKVSLSVPGADAPAVIEVEFRHKGRTEFAAWWESSGGRRDEEILGDVIAGWSDVVDEHGNAVAYTREALALLLDRFPASAIELRDAYARELFEAREKN